MKRVFRWGLGGLVGVLALGAAAIVWLDAADAPPSAHPRPVATDAATISADSALTSSTSCDPALRSAPSAMAAAMEPGPVVSGKVRVPLSRAASTWSIAWRHIACGAAQSRPLRGMAWRCRSGSSSSNSATVRARLRRRLAGLNSAM